MAIFGNTKLKMKNRIPIQFGVIGEFWWGLVCCGDLSAHLSVQGIL